MNTDETKIWMFRQPRCGGTGFTMALADTLNKQHVFVQKNDIIPNDSDILISTHTFELLQYVSTDSLVFRCTRKNKVDQVLSYCLSLLTDQVSGTMFLNIFPNLPVHEESYNAFNQLVETKVTVPKITVCLALSEFMKADKLWNQYESLLNTQTFYYEDMSNSFDIPALSLYNVQLNRDNYAIKLPYDKRNVFLNYDEVVDWVTEYYERQSCFNTKGQ